MIEFRVPVDLQSVERSRPKGAIEVDTVDVRRRRIQGLDDGHAVLRGRDDADLKSLVAIEIRDKVHGELAVEPAALQAQFPAANRLFAERIIRAGNGRCRGTERSR